MREKSIKDSSTVLGRCNREHRRVMYRDEEGDGDGFGERMG